MAMCRPCAEDASPPRSGSAYAGCVLPSREDPVQSAIAYPKYVRTHAGSVLRAGMTRAQASS